MEHTALEFATAGHPLTVSLSVVDGDTHTVRLHYRTLNQNEPFHTLEGGPSFTIPGEDVSARWDLMYYFEVLNSDLTGWFFPDPATRTPYFVVPTRP